MSDRVVLAYSGGLDTSVAIGWLQEHAQAEVIACTVNVGQDPDEVDGIAERAVACGAADAVVVDARREFAVDFVRPALTANARYMGKYPLVSALSRPLIVKHLVELARDRDAGAIAHGCTGKGNDQVRFEVGAMCLAPDLEVLAPIRDWGLSREAAVRWAEERDLPIPSAGESSPYSVDENAWGRTVECGVLEDPWARPPEEVFERTAAVSEAPDESEEITLSFEHGVPIALDDHPMELDELIAELEPRAGRHGIGRIDMIEDRLVGIKSREIYECPAATVLLQAHRDLEDLCLEQELAEHKRSEEGRYAQLIYNGLWWGPLKGALDAFMEEANRYVNGEVRMELFKGRASVVGRRSGRSGLYDYHMATYDDEDAFDQSVSAGFVTLWGLPLKIWAERARTMEGRL